MPCFNSAETISESIRSVLLQTHHNFELIICDDNSTDNTCELVRSFGDPRIILIINKYEKGAAGARNSALSEARGRYIAFLDSDDIWLPKKLELQTQFMLTREIFFSYGSYATFTTSQENLLGTFIPKSSVGRNDILRSCDIGCLTVMIDRKLLHSNFLFPNSPKEDYAAWLTLIGKKVEKAYALPEVLALYRLSKNSASSNKLKEIKKQIYVLRKYGEVRPPALFLCLLSYITRGIIKRYFIYN